ncbi:SDR family NAD(P)-dependent oxidoreductase [Robertmurraya andreesenii]|uniref:NAD(P)-dependent dehydrogenase (Short-subunit alcohol dehydrogenase family) n=1 Tax=Anoxybacillus andreesenii TaxID=1325932 RepID=A0ABT9V8N2_9BACL|nr:SDR family oxidoreductase [Robertmurraya andreesenii]MDQ0157185.1 NAD(P)-dependent dehydrogenase (short-subunit alcohol dehydrogenase family) [Robertmurraya andreesenii]
MSNSQQVVVITGASGGIGNSIVRRFHREGAKLVLLDLKMSNMERSIEDFSPESLLLECDITNKSDVEKARDTVLSHFGKIDVLVNCAGILSSINSIEEVEIEEWRKIIDVNLTGTLICTQVFGGVMLVNGGGSIVNIASMAGLAPSPKKAAYSASKAAVLMLTQQTALEWAGKNIRANAICPGFIETPMISHMIKNEEERRKRESIIPMGRLGMPDEVANIVYFLTTPDAAYINGDSIKLDGGYSVTTMPKIDSKGILA